MDDLVLANLIEDNKGLIYSIIKKYTKYYEFDDLYQVSVMGIIKAFNNYDPRCGTKFTTYAYKYILSEVINYTNNARLIKSSREYNRLYKQILEARNILTQSLMKEPSTYELSLFLELDEEVVNSVLQIKDTVASLDSSISSDGKTVTLIDNISNTKFIDETNKIVLNDMLESLSKEELELIKLRYFEDKTQAEIAKYLHTNQVQVSRNETKILKKLKKSVCKTL